MSIVVVLAIMLASAVDDFTNPAFIASVATLVTAITSLVVAVRASSAGKVTQGVATRAADAAESNGAAIATVQEQTNGQMVALRTHVEALKSQVVAAGLTPWPPAQAQRAGTPGAADTKNSSAGQ